MPAEHCDISAPREVMDLTKPSEQSAELCKMPDPCKATLDYAEHQRVFEGIEPTAHSLEQYNTNGGLADEIEPSLRCNGPTESFEPCMTQPREDTIAPCQHPNPSMSARFSESDECTRQWSVELNKSSEHCDNRDLVSDCGQNCEQCTAHIQPSEQCKPPDPHSESLEPAKQDTNKSDFKPHLSEFSEPISEFECTPQLSRNTSFTDGNLTDLDLTDQRIGISEFAEPLVNQCYMGLDHPNSYFNMPSERVAEQDPNECIHVSEESEYSEETRPAEEEISRDANEYMTLSQHRELSVQNNFYERSETSQEYESSERCESPANCADQNEHTDITGFDHSATFCTEEDQSSECSSSENESSELSSTEDQSSESSSTENESSESSTENESSESSSTENESSESSSTENESSGCSSTGNESSGCSSTENVSSECYSTEDDSYECSFVETQSFDTCIKDTSAPCSDSGESGKGGLSDEQTKWDSFEEDDIVGCNKNNADAEKESCSEDAIELFFDFFDREETYAHSVVQRKPYISCFDGGDVHDLYIVQAQLETKKTNVKDTYKKEETTDGDAYDTSTKNKKASVDEVYEDEACEVRGHHVEELGHGSLTFVAKNDELEAEVQKELINETITGEGAPESEGGLQGIAEDAEGQVSEATEEKAVDAEVLELCVDNETNEPALTEDNCLVAEPFTELNMDQLCVQYDINNTSNGLYQEITEGSVCKEEETTESFNEEDDLNTCSEREPHCSYMYDASNGLNQEITEDSVYEEEEVTEPYNEEDFLNTCSEREPYWSYRDNGELYEPGVEDYYAYEIIAWQPCNKQEVCKPCVRERIFYTQDKDNDYDGREEECNSYDTVLDQEESNPIKFEITEFVEFNGKFTDHAESSTPSVEIETHEENEVQCQNCETEIDEISEKTALGETEHSEELSRYESEQSEQDDKEETREFFKMADENKACEQSEDSEGDESDEEAPETCDCVYCIPPLEQVPDIPLLPQIESKDSGKICVVIDLDETLVHSSFKPVDNADFIIPVEIDGTVHQVYVLKRPHVDEFLKRMGELFECVLFTASLSKYADPVSDLLDKWGAFHHRLFRESCVFHLGNYVKDLSRLGRDLDKVVILDNSPASYIFHPDNAVPVGSWFDDMADTELLELIPFFENLSTVDNIYDILKQQRTES